MRIKTILLAAIFALACLDSMAQAPTPKQIPAKRATGPIRIDGLIDDPAWKEAPKALGYTEFRPTPFKVEDSAVRTEVYMLYSDEGIYLGGYCHERSRDSISTELRGRDGFGNNDFIGFIFDTYNDKINAFEYFVTPLNEQMDSKVSPPLPNTDEEDFTWNAVWQSGAKIHDDGWSFEMFLPFSAIRFSKKNIQDWGLNISRRRQITGQQVAWNPINPTVNGFLTQEGFWTGLENIKPPLRLQFSPYFSTYANHYKSNIAGVNDWTSSVNGGMDVKYGISQALTLDMTLIPDFGQVKSDNTILNLTPFEVKYNENRSFFTEGTELFNKGGLFYSRRVGGLPLHYDEVYNNLGSNETVVSNPITTKLINATKISGRLKNGLGIGFFNALTARTFAIVEDDNKVRRKIETNPISNYNILILDQTLKHNSSISLINTNVWRSGRDYDANVTAALFDFNDKSNTWNLGGKVGTSNLLGYLPNNKTQSGYTHNLYFGKTSGRFNFRIAQTLTDSKYQINDLGYFTTNNFLEHTFGFGYHWTQPGKWYNNLHLNLNGIYSRRLHPSIYQTGNYTISMNGQLKNLWYAGLTLGYEPGGNDFYEPHMENRFFKAWSDGFIDAFVETNIAKKYQVSAELAYIMRSYFSSKRYILGVNNRYRFNNKLSVAYGLNLFPQTNNVGFASIVNNDVIFGRRDINTVENILSIKYNFNSKMGIRADMRHYWSEVNYGDPSTHFYLLMPNGKLEHITSFGDNVDQNYNAFNIDAVFTWEFAPGSFINLVWKNYNFPQPDQTTTEGYFKNLGNTLNAAHDNNISFKILYFFDWLQVKKKKKL